MSYLRIVKQGSGILVTVDRTAPAYIFGPALMAVLAAPPKVRDDAKTLDAFRVLSRLVLGAQEQTPDWSRTVQAIVPDHLTLSLPQADRRYGKLKHQLDLRLGAAAVAMPFLAEAARIRGWSEPKRRNYQVQDRALHVLELEAQRRDVLARRLDSAPEKRFPDSVDNFETRAVRESLPVIHLAAATALAIQKSQDVLAKAAPETVEQYYKCDVNLPDGGVSPQIDVHHILVRREIQDFIIREADALEPLLSSMRVLKPKHVVHFRIE